MEYTKEEREELSYDCSECGNRVEPEDAPNNSDLCEECLKGK